MGHFAKIGDGNIVLTVIVAEQDFIDSYVDSTPGYWVQTSYNTYNGVHYNSKTGQPSEDQSKALRKNFAGIGFTYDKIRDVFIPPKTYNSWILNENTCRWEPPIQYPNIKTYEQDGKIANYNIFWNEENLCWNAKFDEILSSSNKSILKWDISTLTWINV